MRYTRTLVLAGLAMGLACVPLRLDAHSNSTAANTLSNGYSNAPGDSRCTECHGGSPNTNGGSMTIAFADGSTTYAPGQTKRVVVTLADPAARRWGFQLSPRLTSDARNSGAGKLAPSDGNTRLTRDDGTIQWIMHTSAGTRPNTSGSVTFEFDWTAPASDVGQVDFYASGNAANNNGQETPLNTDKIYTAKASFTAGAAGGGGGSKPTIAAGGVQNGASFTDTIQTGSWVTIKGSNLAPNTAGSGRIWDSAKEIVNGRLPTSLDGVSVTINGKPAAVYFVSNGQINVQAPADTAVGPVPVVVTNSNGVSDTFTANLQAASPGLFLFDPQDRKYPAALIAETGGTVAYLGPAGLFGTALTSRPAKPGETILLFGTGFGATNPVVPSGQVYSSAAPTTNAVTATIGGINASVAFAGITGAGLYQINVVVPANAPDGDLPVVLRVSGLATQSNVFVTVKK